jgi:hypothetical protein
MHEVCGSGGPPRKPPHDEDRWRCYVDDEDNLYFYCPECAEREFDG